MEKSEYIVEFNIEGRKNDFLGGRITLKGQVAEKVSKLFQEGKYAKLYAFLKSTARKRLKESAVDGYVHIQYGEGTDVYNLKQAKSVYVKGLYELQGTKCLQFNSPQPKEVPNYEYRLVAFWTSDFEKSLKQGNKADRCISP